MFTLAIISQKGGAGKTTLSVHLACYAEAQGYKTLLIDADIQQSAAKWYQSRKAKAPALVISTAEDMPELIAEAEQSSFDFVVIDTPPILAEDIQIACEHADFILIPTRPSILDLRAIADSAALAKASGIPTGIIIN